MNCTSCGAAVYEHESFCTSCGAKLAKPSTTTQAFAAPPPRTSSPPPAAPYTPPAQPLDQTYEVPVASAASSDAFEEIPRKPVSAKAFVFVALAIVLFVGAAVGGYFLQQKYFRREPAPAVAEVTPIPPPQPVVPAAPPAVSPEPAVSASAEPNVPVASSQPAAPSSVPVLEPSPVKPAVVVRPTTPSGFSRPKLADPTPAAPSPMASSPRPAATSAVRPPAPPEPAPPSGASVDPGSPISAPISSAPPATAPPPVPVPEEIPRRAPPNTRVLNPTGDSPPISNPAPSAPATPPHVTNAPAAPTVRASADEGIIYWTGRLKKNETISLQGMEANIGNASGANFPGSAIDVWLPSPAVALVERPNPQNGWNRVVFRALRSTDRNVTINIQWKRLR